jgi:hypothetical protein
LFVLFTTALTWRKLAAMQLIEAGEGGNADVFAEHSTEACKTLNRAAGTFEYIASTVLPAWEARSKDLLEMNPTLHEMFAALCLAESQSLAAKRALVRAQVNANAICVCARTIGYSNLLLCDDLVGADNHREIVVGCGSAVDARR